MKQIEITKQLCIPNSTVGNWIHRRLCKPFWANVNLSPTKELSYVLGVQLGDGFSFKYLGKGTSHSGLFRRNIGLSATDKEFVVEYARCLSTIVGRKVRVCTLPQEAPRKTKYRATTSCMLIYNLLERVKEDPNGMIPLISDRGAFLRGFFDSEGTIVIQNNGHGQGYTYSLKAYNTNQVALCLMQRMLSYLGIQSKICVSHEASTWDKRRDGSIRIRNRAKLFEIRVLARFKGEFAKYVGFVIKRKQDRLTDWIAVEKTGEKRSRNRENAKIDLYHQEMNDGEMGKKLGLSASAIFEWRKCRGLKPNHRRGRGHVALV